MTQDRFRFAKELPRYAQGSSEFSPVCPSSEFRRADVEPYCWATGYVERKCQTVLGQVDGSGYEIVDRCESSFAEHVVIDDAEILEVSIAITQCAIQRDQRE
jgi:hypothetical protein